MNKKGLSERDICTKFITPAIEKGGWDITTQIFEEFPLTKGREIFYKDMKNYPSLRFYGYSTIDDFERINLCL